MVTGNCTCTDARSHHAGGCQDARGCQGDHAGNAVDVVAETTRYCRVYIWDTLVLTMLHFGYRVLAPFSQVSLARCQIGSCKTFSTIVSLELPQIEPDVHYSRFYARAVAKPTVKDTNTLSLTRI